MNGTLQQTRSVPSDAQAAPQWPRLIWTPVRPSQPSCCCPALPVYQAVVPTVASGRAAPVEILLCAHHYRTSRGALQRLGSAIYDRAGHLVVVPD